MSVHSPQRPCPDAPARGKYCERTASRPLHTATGTIHSGSTLIVIAHRDLWHVQRSLAYRVILLYQAHHLQACKHGKLIIHKAATCRLTTWAAGDQSMLYVHS